MAEQSAKLPGVKYAVAVASGKGGVGKSTVAVNLALALKQQGGTVGLLDADIYGPSIPIMTAVVTSVPGRGQEDKVLPVENYGIKLMSLGFLAASAQAVIWRGPLIHKILDEFLSKVDWGTLDFLVIDLPPGTGDAPLSLSQLIPLTGAVIVATPQPVAICDVERCVDMFRKVRIPLLGIVENMSVYECPKCGDRSELFSHGGAKRASEKWEIPFLGEVPLHISIREGGDRGIPIVVSASDSPQGRAFHEIARSLQKVVTQTKPLKIVE